MIGEFFEWLLGPSAREIVLAVGAFGTFLGAIAALLQWRRRQQADEKVDLLHVKLREQHQELESERTKLSSRMRELEEREGKLHTIRKAVLGSDHDLWLIHEPRPFVGYRNLIAGRSPKVIVVANLKGGVGKTTLAANLAANLDGHLRVLLIDLDYQGSLSSMMLFAAKLPAVESRVDQILEGKLRSERFQDIAFHLEGVLPNTWIIPAYYKLATLENRLMVQWLLQEAGDDVRYRLANFVFSESIRSNFDVVLIDCPPRLTTGSVNALCCGTHLLVPTVFDKLSSEAVGTFLDAVRKLRATLNPGLQLLGVVGAITHEQNQLHESEVFAKGMIEKQARIAWREPAHIFDRFIPRRMAFSRAAGQSVAYKDDRDVRNLIDPLGAAIRERLGL